MGLRSAEEPQFVLGSRGGPSRALWVGIGGCEPTDTLRSLPAYPPLAPMRPPLWKPLVVLAPVMFVLGAVLAAWLGDTGLVIALTIAFVLSRLVVRVQWARWHRHPD